ncbi:hypothetical protein [Methylobacterium sp. WL18]|uniref:hypothetical protein n=1 Tax=Methylobacterium sp. WL18 TaxID=2603897 RepID=UPI001FED550D|nr:hypothetical protein [Methylobacterium sp. WL18]
MFLLMALVEILGIDEIANHLRSSAITPEFGDVTAPMVVGQTVLQVRRPRDLVRTILAGPPIGLLGALDRIGPEPFGEPRTYYELCRLFLSRDPDDRRRAKVISQISGNLVGDQIRIVSMLDPVLLHPAFVATVYDVRQVAEIHNALAYVRQHCSGATDEAIRASLGRIKPGGHRSELIKGWAERFDRVPTMLDTRGDLTLRVIDSATALADAGRRFRNCLATKVFETVLGVYLYVEYEPIDPQEPGVIAELRRTNQGYVLEGLHATNNRRVLPHRARLIRDKLAALGVAILAHAPGDRDAIHAAAQMLGEHKLMEADCNGWGDELLPVEEDLEQLLAEAA